MIFDIINPSNYDALLMEKSEKITAAFAHLTPPELEVFPSTPLHYRMRAEFRVWHDGDDLYYYMFDQKEQKNIRCDQFLPASKLINQVMIALMDLLRPNETLRQKLFQVDFLSTLSGEIIVSLLYHRQLDELWLEEAEQLKAALNLNFKLDIIGRARKQKFMLGNDFVIEKIPVNGRTYTYQQVENSFTQPNTLVAIKMLEWAIDCTKNSTGDLLELYCGNGNFSIALAQNFDKVLATEMAKPSVNAAQYNITANNIDNLTILRMSAEDFTDAMNGKRAFRRLQGVDLTSYQCNTIFVDPPRAGLDDATLELVQNYEHILYISCNPTTLLENMKTLSLTHEIKRFALFDQFPYTDHIESGVLLTKKPTV